MNTKPILLLDMDGPLADFDQAFYDLCTRAGYDLNIFGLDDPCRSRFMTDNMTDATQRTRARNHVDQTDWFRHLPVTAGAKDGIAELEDHFDVWVCTKPLEANPRCRDDKAFWIHRHFPQFEHKLIMAPDKSMVHGAVLLDDAPKWRWIGKATWRPVVFTAPYNVPPHMLGGLPHWTWGDPIDVLLAAANEAAFRGYPQRWMTGANVNVHIEEPPPRIIPVPVEAGQRMHV